MEAVGGEVPSHKGRSRASEWVRRGVGRPGEALGPYLEPRVPAGASEQGKTVETGDGWGWGAGQLQAKRGPGVLRTECAVRCIRGVCPGPGIPRREEVCGAGVVRRGPVRLVPAGQGEWASGRLDIRSRTSGAKTKAWRLQGRKPASQVPGILSERPEDQHRHACRLGTDHHRSRRRG